MSLKENIQAAQVDLIKELKIDEMPEEQRATLLVQMSEVIQQRIILRLIEEMAEDKKEEFTELLNGGADASEGIDAFLEEALPNVEELILDEIGKYKLEMKQFVEGAMSGKSPEEETEAGEDASSEE